MEYAKVLRATKELLEEIIASEEFDEFKETVEGMRTLNLIPKPESNFLIAVGGKLVDEAKNIVDLIGRDWLVVLTDLIDDLGVGYFADLYEVPEWEDVYDVYEKQDFSLIDKLYERLDEKAFTEIKYKANPYEEENVQGFGDRTITVLNFESAEEYAEYLMLEGLNNIRIDLESGWANEDDTEDFDEFEPPWFFDE